jgi:hypothetical protein
LFAATSVALACAAFGQAGPRGADAPSRKSSAHVALPSADQILRKFLDATGGRGAWKKMHSRLSRGTVVIPGMNLSGTAEMYEKEPNLALVEITVSGSEFLEGFDGKVAWTSDPKDGLREQTGAQLAETRRASDFRFPLDFRKLYPTVSAPRAGQIGERSVYIIDATPAGGGQPDRAYFDSQTGLLLRLVTQHHSEDGSVEPFEQDFSDYRAVEGVQIPFTLHQSGPQVDFTIQLRNVEANVPLDDARFSKPVAH